MSSRPFFFSWLESMLLAQHRLEPGKKKNFGTDGQTDGQDSEKKVMLKRFFSLIGRISSTASLCL